MNIGIVCYASVGGSGVVATELAHALARRGHEVHLISSDEPFRWRAGVPRLSFERVETPAYPLFREPQYLLALANTIVRLSRDQRLDIVHAHYAVPHATAAYLADQILAPTAWPAPPRTVTTLHGTDITLVGSDPSYARVVAFSIEQSHGVTAVSESLRRTRSRPWVSPETFASSRTSSTARSTAGGRCRSCASGCSPAACERSSCTCRISGRSSASDAVLEIFQRIRARLPRAARDDWRRTRTPPARAACRRGRSGSDVVEFAGEQHDLVPWLSAADLFLLPSRTGKLRPGGARGDGVRGAGRGVARRRPAGNHRGRRTGFLCAPDDLEGMAERGVAVLSDPDLQERIGRAAAEDVRTRFCTDLIVSQYRAVLPRRARFKVAQPFIPRRGSGCPELVEGQGCPAALGRPEGLRYVRPPAILFQPSRRFAVYGGDIRA